MAPSMHGPIAEGVARRRAGACRALLVAVVVLTSLAVSTRPAAAHGNAGDGATNFVTRLSAFEPAVPGLSARPIEHGDRFEVRNVTDRELVVMGYADEAYLRIGPEGIFENRRSPATYLNGDREANTGGMPADVDPDAEPAWRKISDGRVARWHDHRIHWMGGQPPAQVRAAPGERHVVLPVWRIPMRWGDQVVEARGDLVWVPGPSPWPWLLAASVVMAGVLVVSQRRRWSAGVVVVVVLVAVVHVLHAIGTARAAVGGPADELWALLRGSWHVGPALVAAATSVRLLLRRDADGLLAAGLFGALVALLGGVADLTDLSRSQLGWAWSPTLARALVASSLGGGVGLVVAAGWRWHREGAGRAVEAPPLGSA